jgi:hypothetical protein
LKLVPPGPAYFAPKPVVIHTDDRRNGISFPTTALVSWDQIPGVGTTVTWLDIWDDLHSRRSATDDGYCLSRQVILPIPRRAVHKLATKLFNTWNIGILVSAGLIHY